jgi:hypothetical protein
MILRIQDPQHSTAPSLHESLLEACQGATGGGGAFAFVSQGGVELFLGDEIFTAFAARHPFELVVGIDEVTNTKALNALTAAGESLAGLTVRVFHHDLPHAIFHPKFCWFRHETGGTLITGSGNLTVRGLRRNWEAFTVSVLGPEEVDEVERLWAGWVGAHAAWLKATDDERVLARAEQNVIRRAPRVPGEVTAAGAGEAAETEDDVAGGPHLEDDAVLIAELPRSGDRWNQANFDLENFTTFFEATPGATQRVIFQHVDASGALGARETRPSVAVRSQNYRFELEAAAGLEYPRRGRPIAVFVRVATRAFKYRLLMPDDPEHATVRKFLVSRWRGRADRMMRVPTTIGELRRAWPNSPLWRAL